MQPLEDALGPARTAFQQFLTSLDPAGRLVVFCHFDADGLAAGAVFGRALPRLGFRDVLVLASGRGESAFSPEARQRLANLNPAALIVTDLGVNRAGVLPDVPTLYVDHHQPAGEPAGATVLSGYGWEPIPNSAWMAYELLRPLTDISDLDWIAAIGTISDLGEHAPWPELAAIKKRYTAKWLKEAVALINAARRSSTFDIETPLHMLMQATAPRQISEDEALGAASLRGYRAEVNAALAEARKQAPVFSGNQPFSLIRIDSTCQIHPLIAQQWRGRLPKYAAIAANRGYLPGSVAFSARTSRSDLNLPAIFQGIDLGGAYASYGYGHDQASGGQLPNQAFARLLQALGFPESALA